MFNWVMFTAPVSVTVKLISTLDWPDSAVLGDTLAENVTAFTAFAMKTNDNKEKMYALIFT